MFALRRLRITAAVAIGTVVLGAIVFVTHRSDDDPTPPSAALVSFDDCTQLLDYLQTHGRDLVDARRSSGYYDSWSFPGDTGLPEGAENLQRDRAVDGAEATVPAAEAGSASSDKSGDGSAGSGTGTNVQVVGVDEADLAKRVDDLMLSVGSDPSQGLRITRIRDGSATVLSTLDTPGWLPSTLLVDGSTAVLIGQVGDRVVPMSRADDPDGSLRIREPQVVRTRLMQVDLSDPTRPAVVSTLDLDGQPGAARLVDGVIRVAVTSSPTGLDLVEPTTYDSLSLNRAWEENRRRIAESTVEDWLPSYRAWQGPAPASGTSGATPVSAGQLTACGQVQAPAEYSGLSTTALVSADLRAPEGIHGWQAGGVLAEGTMMYATAEHTYLATTGWPSSPAEEAARQSRRTQIHLFDTTGARTPRHLASGQVPGHLLNQFAMDEFDGVLRVASTLQGSELAEPMATETVMDESSGIAPVSQAQVSVLRRDGNRLVTVGSVAGLGMGEQIYAVRFLGEVGYVVTFRQTDPLYTLDLRDPSAPKATGELKILGYSAYLHPMGRGRLLGIGRDATAEGRVTGLSVSLFDVTDPAAPTRTDHVTVPDAWSSAEQDHHAVTVADDLLLIPFQGSGAEITGPDTATSSPGYGSGVLAVRMGQDGLTDPTPLAVFPASVREGEPSSGYAGTALRTYVVDGSIWTLTTAGVAVHDASTLRWQAYVAFTTR
jgi:hypothetical protein